MEVALSLRFLDSTILFSMYNGFEKNLKTEMWLCHEHMNLSMNEIYTMTVADRKSFITIHNREIEKQKEKLKIRKPKTK